MLMDSFLQIMLLTNPNPFSLSPLHLISLAHAASAGIFPDLQQTADGNLRNKREYCTGV